MSSSWEGRLRNLWLAVSFLGVFTTCLSAQSTSKVELFGGYQFLHAGSFDGEGDSVNTNGWNTAATFNLKNHLGLVADFSGNYRSENIAGFPAHIHIYTYTFGPVVSWKAHHDLRMFAHALFGEGHLPTGCAIFSGSPDECGSGAVSGFAMMLGGGLDAMADKPLGLRLFQFDWVSFPSQFGRQDGNVRVSSGIIFRF